MNPIYFHSGKNKLFGVENISEQINFCSRNILICSPVGNEYIRSYHLLRQLALMLQNAGHTVFRFDWYGYGDSEGCAKDASVSIWIKNIIDAAIRLLDLGVKNRPLTIVGYRLGASLAYKATPDLPDLEKLVLWDPVIIGKNWLEKLSSVHQDFLKYVFPTPKEISTSEEFLGFEISKQMQQQICQINLKNDLIPACKLLLVNSEKDDDCTEFCQYLRYGNKGFENKTLNLQQVWSDPTTYDKILMNSPALAVIKKVLTGGVND